MKKKVSLAFVLMCFAAALSLIDFFNYCPYIGLLFQKFSIHAVLNVLCNTAACFAPAMIVALLYLNKKRDVKPIAYIVLIACGGFKLFGGVLAFLSMLNKGLVYSVPNLFVTLSNNVILGLLFIVVANSIKSNTTFSSVKRLAVVNLWLGAFLLLIEFIIPGNVSIPACLLTALLTLSLWLLPQTFYDYDNCTFLDKDTMILSAVIALVVLLAIGITTGVLNSANSEPSCGHQSCKKYGPFPCNGKNNTCSNTTNCAYDLYCDKCD